MLSARLPAARSPAAGDPRPLAAWQAEAQTGNTELRIRLLAADVAAREASKLAFQSAVTVELVAQASRDRLHGSGDFGPAAYRGTDRTIGVQMSVPLYTGGLRSARREEALRLADKAVVEVDRSRQQTAQQVHAAWLGLRVGTERTASLAEGLKASEARRDATRLGYQVGERTTLDVLNAENDAASARLALAQARVGLLMDRLRLAAISGRLDDDLLREVNDALEPAPRD